MLWIVKASLQSGLAMILKAAYPGSYLFMQDF